MRTLRTWRAAVGRAVAAGCCALLLTVAATAFCEAAERGPEAASQPAHGAEDLTAASSRTPSATPPSSSLLSSSTAPFHAETQPVLEGSCGAKDGGRENTPIHRQAPGPADGWGRTVLALAVVLAVILILRAVLKKISRPAALARGGAIEVLARATVLPRQHLMLVRLGRRLVLVGSSPAGLAALATITDPEEVAELTDSTISGEELKRLADKGRPKPGAAGEGQSR